MSIWQGNHLMEGHYPLRQGSIFLVVIKFQQIPVQIQTEHDMYPYNIYAEK